MLRALLLGVWVVSATASCKSKSDAPAVAVGAAAGKVVEVSGKVDATRDGKTRTLTMGAEVYPDDQVATSADATVTIELFHNGAKWSVVSNKTARVDASLAWGLDKQAASKTVDHNSAAAGRNAERSAADTASTAAIKEEQKPGAAAAESAPMPEPTAGGPPPVETTGSPPPPPPPPVAKPPARDKRAAPGGSPPPAKIESSKKSADAAPRDMAPAPDPQPEKMSIVITPQTLAERQRPAFEKCLDANASKVTITIKVNENKTTVALSGSGNITDKVRSCVDGVAQKIEWPIKGTFDVVLKFD